MLIPFGVFSAAGAGGGGGAGDFELISTAYGTGSSGIVSFTSIAQTYKHLQVRVVANSGSDHIIKFNGNTMNNRHILAGGSYTSTPQYSYYSGNGFLTDGGGTSSDYYAMVIDILDYASTTKNKVTRTLSGLLGGSTSRVGLNSTLLTNTAAVSSVNIELTSGNFTTASRFSLYGIKG